MQSNEVETMPAELAVAAEVRPATSYKLSSKEIRADVNLIQEVLKNVMLKDVHYGVVPGCGDKPTLLKPGAEKIMATFRLSAEPLIDDLSTADEIRYRIRMRVTHQITKLEIGWGVGECSSNETKYKWISPACDEEFNETPEDRRRIKWAKTRDGKPYKKKQIRANLSDVANTVLKIAKKRGLVDATLTCTAASDCFTQDIEDLPEDIARNVERPKAAPAANVQRASAPVPAPRPAPVAPQPEVDPADDYYDDADIVDSEPTPQAPARAATPRKVQLDMEVARRMDAKFRAPCKFCGKNIEKGEPMVYMPEGSTKGGYHAACVTE